MSTSADNEPGLAALLFGDETFHVWLVPAVIPTSVFALTMGCKRHKQYRLLALGLVGLLLLVSAAYAGEEHIGEFREKALTVTGAAAIALGHFWNYRLCRQQDCFACPDQRAGLSE